jgi:hypothetical protein
LSVEPIAAFVDDLGGRSFACDGDERDNGEMLMHELCLFDVGMHVLAAY